MPVPTRTLRALLLALAVLLIAVVLAFLGYAHHRAKSFLAGLPGRLGMSIDKETDNFNFSQSYKDKVIFTVHAARQVQHDNGHYTLHDATVTLYGRGETGRPGTKSNAADANRVDTIHGAEFEFDQPNGTLSAAGDVFLDLDASPPANPANAASTTAQAQAHTPSEADLVHIKTSGLVYTQKTRVASTGNFIEFHRAGISGTAVGATYTAEGGVIVLQSQVHVTGVRNGRPLQLDAAHAEFDQSSNLLKLASAHYTAPGASGPESLTADRALVRMTENNEPRRLETEGHVTLAAQGRGTVQTAAMNVDLNPHGQPTLAVLTGGVRFAGSPSESSRDERGTASAARLTFDPLGRPAHVSLTGGAELTEAAPAGDRMLRAADVELAFTASPGTSSGRPSAAKSSLSGAEAFGPAGATLRLVDRTRATAPSPGAPASAAASSVASTATEVHASRLTGRFTRPAGDASQLTGLDGSGQTSIEQVDQSAAGLALSRSRSTGDTLRLDFATANPPSAGKNTPRHTGAHPATRLQLARAEQHGNVTIERQAAARKPGEPAEVLHATAANSVFSASADTLTLDGNVAFNDGSSDLLADRLTLAHVNLDRPNATSEAVGNVRISFIQTPPAGSGPAQPASPPAEPIHVLAARATAARATGLSQFFAAPGGRVRLWQAGSQVEAPRVDLNRSARTLAAFSLGPGPEVRTILTAAAPHTGSRAASQPPSQTTARETTASQARPATPAGPARILSHEMLFLDAAREIDFRGAVHVDTSTGSTSAQEARVFLASAAKATGTAPLAPSPLAPSPLAPGPLGGTLFGSGQIDHIIATGDIQIVQPGRKATGDRLVYTAADQTFVLTGTPAAPPHLTDDTRGAVTGALLRFHTGNDAVEVESAPGSRVHTETRSK